jgi:hypothetical protein
MADDGAARLAPAGVPPSGLLTACRPYTASRSRAIVRVPSASDEPPVTIAAAAPTMNARLRPISACLGRRRPSNRGSLTHSSGECWNVLEERRAGDRSSILGAAGRSATCCGLAAGASSVRALPLRVGDANPESLVPLEGQPKRRAGGHACRAATKRRRAQHPQPMRQLPLPRLGPTRVTQLPSRLAPTQRHGPATDGEAGRDCATR